ncbi:uncharacterized protein LOC122261351 isoform X2 [Penaeus japonicus]|uniref:uncharacterized protein LOC122261351 isoform X2 n=1 Tax=Penaeus japonicus TaxID=27405 RepID=UPI001C717A89|nr:uncharacterized protein LOC122261351 isoform X2 [Penaeus japonicus]
MEKTDKDELAAQLAKMKKQLRKKERQLRKYNKALEVKKYVQETIKRQNIQLSSQDAVPNGDLVEAREEREGRSNDSRIVTFSEKEPEVIYMSPSDQNAKKIKGKKKAKRDVLNLDIQEEEEKQMDLTEEKVGRNVSPLVSSPTENSGGTLSVNHLSATSGDEVKDLVNRREIITSREEGIMIDCNGEDSSYDSQNSADVKNIPDVNDQLKDMNDYLTSDLTEAFEEEEAKLCPVIKEKGQDSSLVDSALKDSSATPSIPNKVPIMDQSDIKPCPTTTCTSDLNAHGNTDTLLKQSAVPKCPTFKGVAESQDLFETPQNNISSLQDNIDIKRRCKPIAKHALRRLTPESWEGKSGPSIGVSDKKIGKCLENDSVSVKINKSRTVESDSKFVMDTYNVTTERKFNSASVSEKQTKEMDLPEGRHIHKNEEKVCENRSLVEMFESSLENEELEEEMMVAAISAEEGVMNGAEKYSETEPDCGYKKSPEISMTETKEYEDTVNFADEDNKFFENISTDVPQPALSTCATGSRVPPSDEKVIYQTLVSREKFGKILTSSVMVVKGKDREAARVLLVHEFGFTQWETSDKEGNADDLTQNIHQNTSSHKWSLTDEIDYHVGYVPEMRNIAVIGLPSEDEARYLMILEKFLERELVMIYVQLTSNRTIETAVVPVQCKMYKKMLCCSLGEWSVIMYWRPEVASKEGSLMVTDFDVTYSKRSKKWLLQSHSDIAYPQWDDSLVSLVPVNGPGSEGIVLCTTSTEMYVYDALQDMILMQIPWHMSVICWAVSIKEYLFITSITAEEAQVSVVNPVNGESETFCSCPVKLKSDEVEEPSKLKLTGACYLQELVLAYSNGTVACIPLRE